MSLPTSVRPTHVDSRKVRPSLLPFIPSRLSGDAAELMTLLLDLAPDWAEKKDLAGHMWFKLKSLDIDVVQSLKGRIEAIYAKEQAAFQLQY